MSAATALLCWCRSQLPKNFILRQAMLRDTFITASVLPTWPPLHTIALPSHVILQHLNSTIECNHMLSYSTTSLLSNAILQHHISATPQSYSLEFSYPKSNPCSYSTLIDTHGMKLFYISSNQWRNII